MEEHKNFSCDGKIALVTGGASGIGRAIAHTFSSMGGRVVIMDSNLEGAENVASEIDSKDKRAISVGGDITKVDDIQRAIHTANEEMGSIDTLFAVPGINVRKAIINMEENDFMSVLNVNLKGTFNLFKIVGKSMISSGKGGSVVAISSIRAKTVEPGIGPYAATKAGIIQLVRVFASEVGKYGIRVNAIAPGQITTPPTLRFTKGNPEWYKVRAEKSILKRWAEPEEVARPAVFLTMEACSFITGTVLFVDGGWTAIDGRFDPPIEY